MTYKEAMEDNLKSFFRDHTTISNINSTRKTNHNSCASASEEDVQGRVLHISLPAGTEFNILNLIEIISPEGISLDAKLPFLSSDTTASHLTSGLNDILNSIVQAGGTFEISQL